MTIFCDEEVLRMKKNNHFTLGDLVQELAPTQHIGLVVEIELEMPMGFSVQTEEPLFFNQARVLWFGKTSKPATSWRMFRELSVLNACN
jgi:hypothetical protein